MISDATDNFTPDVPDVSAIANYYGGARNVAHLIGKAVGRRSLVVVPFAGGLSEAAYFDANRLLINDLNRAVINLATVVADPVKGPALYRRLRRTPFHAESLAAAQCRCRIIEADPKIAERPLGCEKWAEWTAIASWMGRGGKTGQRGQFAGSLPLRYGTSGGSSVARFQGWANSLVAWRRVLRKAEFASECGLRLIERIPDQADIAIYADAPWRGPEGDLYAHRFADADHVALAERLGRFKKAKVVVRYGVHPVIDSLYPESSWDRLHVGSRSQANGDVKEYLLANREAA